MDRFLLATPDSVLRTHGVRRAFDSVAAANAALREGAAELIVGALPFDPQAAAALVAPEQAAHTAGPWRPAAVPGLPVVRIVSELPSAAEHIARVEKLVERLGDPDGTLRKVVAARSLLVRAEETLDPEIIAARLVTRHPRANVFAVDLTPAGRTGETLIGATPETLVARHGGTLTLHPLAGSAPRLQDPDADAEQARNLLSSSKNREEHAYVVDWIRERLSPVCRDLVIPAEPELLATPEVWHLATPIRGELADPTVTALDLAVLLYPTPAVGGTPTAEALDLILGEEERGFYGGAVGWCDATGDGEWFVAIRCAELDADHRTLRAFAGGGLVATSDPRTELDETTVKLRTFLGSLDCALPD